MGGMGRGWSLVGGSLGRGGGRGEGLSWGIMSVGVLGIMTVRGMGGRLLMGGQEKISSEIVIGVWILGLNGLEMIMPMPIPVIRAGWGVAVGIWVRGIVLMRETNETCSTILMTIMWSCWARLT